MGAHDPLHSTTHFRMTNKNGCFEAITGVLLLCVWMFVVIHPAAAFSNHNNGYYTQNKKRGVQHHVSIPSPFRSSSRSLSARSDDSMDKRSKSLKFVDSNGTTDPKNNKKDDDAKNIKDDEVSNAFNRDTAGGEYYSVDEECVVGDMCQLTEYVHDYDVGVLELNGNGNTYTNNSNNNKEIGDDSLLVESPVIMIDRLLTWIPVLLPGIAYILYDPIYALFHDTLEYIADIAYGQKWVAVDGGDYQAKIITPAINGIVLPSVSILFATLIGTTITTLRQRQLDIRNCVNMEAGQIRILQSIFFASNAPLALLHNNNNGSRNMVFPSSSNNGKGSNNSSNNNGKEQVIQQQKQQQRQQQYQQHLEKCRYYLIQYTSRLIDEGHQTVSANSLDLSGMDSELNGLLTELNYMSHYPTDVLSPAMLDQCYVACNRLFDERAKRITYLQSTFPTLHYIVVTALAASICLGFLMETNQEILFFLTGIQLRILWTILVGTFSGLVFVVYDLSNPFRGSYQISKSIDQLYTIRLALRASSSSFSKGKDKSKK